MAEMTLAEKYEELCEILEDEKLTAEHESMFYLGADSALNLLALELASADELEAEIRTRVVIAKAKMKPGGLLP